MDEKQEVRKENLIALQHRQNAEQSTTGQNVLWCWSKCSMALVKMFYGAGQNVL